MLKKYSYTILLSLAYPCAIKSSDISNQTSLDQLHIFVQTMQDINHGIQLYDITVDTKNCARELWDHLSQYPYMVLEKQKQKNTHLCLLEQITHTACNGVSILIKAVNPLRLCPTLTRTCIQKIIQLQNHCKNFRAHQKTIKKQLYYYFAYHATQQFVTEGALMGLLIGTPWYTANLFFNQSYEYTTNSIVSKSIFTPSSQAGALALIGMSYSALLYQYGKKALETSYTKIQDLKRTWHNLNHLIKIMDAANTVVQKIEDQAALIQKTLERCS